MHPTDPLEGILRHLTCRRGLDPTGFQPFFLQQRIRRRCVERGCSDARSYLAVLQAEPDEADALIDALSINVSGFFREALTLEYVRTRLLPLLAAQKAAAGETSLRVWSAGCACGEEAYSLAILLREMPTNGDAGLDVHLFASDVDPNAIRTARRGLYPKERVRNVKLGLLERYFVPEPGGYRVVPEIRGTVAFSVYDLLDPKTSAPPESIYGGFDLVLCRNLLIYYTEAYRARILEKLAQALADGAFLVLGEAEVLTPQVRDRFDAHADVCRIYRRRPRGDRAPAGNDD